MRYILLVLIAAFANALLGQGRFDKVEIKETKLTDNIYMLEGAGGNIGLYVGEKETFMIDDQFAPLSEKIMAKIATLTDLPVSQLANTHWHGDHSGGNENFGKKGAMIFAHDNVYARMSVETKRGDRVSPASPAIALPVVTFSESMHLRTLEEPVMMVHAHNAHTDGDAIVYFLESNVVHMGDCFFNGRFPFIDLNSGGSLDGLIEAAEAVSLMIDEETQIIPGHGPMGNAEDLKNYHTFLVTLKTRVQAAIDAGTTAEDLDHDAIVAGYEEWGGAFIDAKKMVQTAFSSLSK